MVFRGCVVVAATGLGLALMAAPAPASTATADTGELKPGGAPLVTSEYEVAPEVESLIVSFSEGSAPLTPQGQVTGSEQVPWVDLADGGDLGFGVRILDFPAAVSVEQAAATAASLATSSAIEWAEPNYRVRMFADPVTPAATQGTAPWGLDRVDQRSGLDTRYNYDTAGSGVTAYVVDTGLRTSHQEFVGRVPRGAYTIDDGRGVQDCHGHGTHVAGTIAGTTYGIAKSAQIVPVRVMDCSNSGTVSDLISALNWIVNDHPYSSPAVVNLSLGTPPSSGVDDAVRRAVLDNITVVAASGNEADNACNVSPARVSEAITVNASTYPDDDANFSNYGPCTDIYAPGTGIYSAYSTSDTATMRMDGTSMAAPHVTGAVARLLSLAPTMTPAQVWQRLGTQATAVDFLPSVPSDAKRLLHIPPPLTAPPASVFIPIDPVRVLDTRPMQGGDGPLGSREARTISVANQIAWHGGASGVVPAGALAVAYNLTVPAGAWSGHMRVMPGDAPLPAASAINFGANSTIANGLITRIDGQRRIKVYNAAGGPTNALIDVVGYFMPAAAAPTGGRFTAVTPVRVYDAGAAPLAPGATRTVSVANQLPSEGGATNVVPAGATAVAYNITVVRPNAGGHMRVFPGDKASSPASTINWTGTGDVVANGLQVRLAADRTIRVYNAAGAPVRFLVDVVGYYRAGSGGYFYATDPARAYDSRAPLPSPGPLGTGIGQVVRTVLVNNGRDANGYLETLGVVPSGATAIAYNLTAPSTSASGHMRVFPASVSLVGASALNWPGPGYTRANASIVAVPADRRVSIYNGSAAGNHAILDTLGYFK